MTIVARYNSKMSPESGTIRAVQIAAIQINKMVANTLAYFIASIIPDAIREVKTHWRPSKENTLIIVERLIY